MDYYRNLKQLDKAIKVRELEAEIEKEKLNLQVAHTKEELSPKRLFKNVMTIISIKKIVDNLRKKRRRR